MSKKFQRLLEGLGLSPKEALVYLTVLELGPCKVLKIAKVSTLKRSTVYSVLENLLEKGLVSSETKGFKRYVVAEDPQHLASVLEQKRKDLNKALPELSALYHQISPSESLIRHYQGVEGAKRIFESVLTQLKHGDFFYVVSDQHKWLRMDPEYFADWRERRGRLNLDVRLLLQDSPTARTSIKTEGVRDEKILLLPEEIKLKTNLIIIPNKVITLQIVEPILGVVIENKSFVEMNKVLFDAAWTMAHKPN